MTKKANLRRSTRGQSTDRKNQRSISSVNKSRHSLTKITSVARKSDKVVRKKIIGRREGDFRNTPRKDVSTPKKVEKSSTTPSRIQNLTKSPRVDPHRKMANLNTPSGSKNAPSATKNKTRKTGKIKKPRQKKEFQIVIGTPGRRAIKSVSKAKSLSEKRELRSRSASKAATPNVSTIKSKKKSPIKKKEIQIMLDTPRTRRQAQRVQSESKSQSGSSARKGTPKKIEANLSKEPSKAKQRIQLLTKSEDEEDDFIKKVRASASPRKVEITQRKKALVSVSKSPAKSPGRQSQTPKSILIKTKKELIPVKKVTTRQGRKTSVNKKEFENAMTTLDKVRASPRKISVGKKTPSVTPSKSRERSRVHEDKKLRPVSKQTPTAVIKLPQPQNNLAKRSKVPVMMTPSHSSSRTPTKRFQKEKTPSSESSSEVSEKVPKKRFGRKILPSKPSAQAKKIIIKEESEDSEEEEVSSSSEEEKKLGASSVKSKIVKRPIKHQLAYKVDTKGISDEITKILKKIEERKKGPQTSEVKSRIKGPGKGGRKLLITKKLSAKDYGFKLQKNPNIKTEHIIKIADLVSKPIKTHSDILLAILEIASNADYYQISFLNNSRFFWEDVILYEELSKIFEGYKGETLRKYWRYLSSIGDVNKISDLVKRHKKFLDETDIKLLSIISAIRGYFSGEIKDFEEGIKNQKKEAKSKEVSIEEGVDKKGNRLKVKTVREITKMKSRFEKQGNVKEFTGVNFKGPVDDIFGKTKIDKPNGYLEYVRRTRNEEKSKFVFLHNQTEEEKRKILSISEEEKFLFNVIDGMVNSLHKDFPHLTTNYISDVLHTCSFNIEQAYHYLKEKNTSAVFTEVEDEVILKMKNNAEFKNLVRMKGADKVQEREDYLVA